MEWALIDAAPALTDLLDSFSTLPNSPPSLFIDLEGDNLSRHGTVSLLQIYVEPYRKTYLVDIHQLGGQAFTISSTKVGSLKTIWESSTFKKVFFDVRRDSDALYSLFQINLNGVQDLQLIELATRTFDKKCVNGLKKCIERDACLSASESREWMRNKDAGLALFDPTLGGSYAVFNERPISEAIQMYCIQDVTYLPRLWRTYDRKMSSASWVKVDEATRDPIEDSHSCYYNGKGHHMALSPWPGWPISMNPNLK